MRQQTSTSWLYRLTAAHVLNWIVHLGRFSVLDAFTVPRILTRTERVTLACGFFRWPGAAVIYGPVTVAMALKNEQDRTVAWPYGEPWPLRA